MNIKWQEKKQQFESFAQTYLHEQNSPSNILSEAMAYSLLNGGKRIRALLSYIVGEAFQVSVQSQNLIALSLESIHAYSLIHDDLPAMDDDDLRRGKPTSHIKFGQATAILAGDALQSLAFKALSQINDLNFKQLKNIVSLLADYSGMQGMVAGQQMDISAEAKDITLSELKKVHQYKTGKIISASVLLPFYASNSHLDTNTEYNIGKFAECIGLAFQVKDDILDITADSKTLGKNSQSDLKHKKSTYPALIGLKKSQNTLDQLMSLAQNYIRDSKINNMSEIMEVAKYITNRTY